MFANKLAKLINYVPNSVEVRKGLLSSIKDLIFDI